MNSITNIHHTAHAHSAISTMAIQQRHTFKWSYVSGHQSDSPEILRNSSLFSVSRQDLEVQYSLQDYMLMTVFVQMHTQMQDKHFEKSSLESHLEYSAASALCVVSLVTSVKLQSLNMWLGCMHLFQHTQNNRRT